MLPGITYSADHGSLAVFGAGYNNRSNTGPIFGTKDVDATFTLTFASANVVGFNLYGGLLVGNTYFSVFNPRGDLLSSFGTFFGFIGIVSEGDQIGRISLSSYNFPPAVGNLSFGEVAAATPEPATWLLAIVGLMAILKRKRLAFQNTSHATAAGGKGAGPA